MARPNVGMMYPVWAPLTTHTDGSMPTYSGGAVIQEAISATVTREYANNPLYGDDKIVDDDNGMTGMTISFESTGLTDAERKMLFGEEDYGTSGVSGQWVSDNETPWGGFGYIRKMRDNGTKKFEAWWTLKIKFQEETQATNTKQGAIQWNTPTLNGRAAGLDVDGTDKQRFQLHKSFDAIAAAKAWLNSLAGITG